jgi:hypothetical protein
MPAERGHVCATRWSVFGKDATQDAAWIIGIHCGRTRTHASAPCARASDSSADGVTHPPPGLGRDIQHVLNVARRSRSVATKASTVIHGLLAWPASGTLERTPEVGETTR